jgi:hypothetical protein
MAIPPKSRQAKWLANQLDKGAEEGESLERFSLRIVSSFHEMLAQGIKLGVPFPHKGTVFKGPHTAKNYCVAWQEGDHLWLVAEDSTFGDFCRTDDPIWQYTEASRSDPARYVKNPDWGVDQYVSRGQRHYIGKVIAVGNKCVLLEDARTGQIQPESNENMKRYYRREG